MALELQPGDTYADFRIRRLLRTYAHACVYEVNAAGHGTPVDLKLSLEPVLSEEEARRALREVAVLETLTNKHVVKVQGSGMGPDDRWYVVLEHLQGAQLSYWHDFDVPLPAADAVELIHHACLGLAEVHAAGIVHRDLGPSWLWVEPDRTLKIMDFTSARSWGMSATGDNVTVGRVASVTPQYAAPERIHVPQLTPAADVYSLGVLLYEMLSGRSPFFPDRSWSWTRTAGDTDAGLWIRAHEETTPTPLADFTAAVAGPFPEKLTQLVDRCIAKDPSVRPASAADLANELGWILHHGLGAAQAAVLRAAPDDGQPSYHLVLPGSHRVAVDSIGAVQLDRPSSPDALVLEWSGGDTSAEVVPQSGVNLTVNGQSVAGRTTLGAGDVVGVAGTELTVGYPTRPSPT